MQTANVPARVYELPCSACRKLVSFPMFRASFYGFSTYRGVRTGNFYRVDLDRIAHGKLDIDRELAAAATRFEESFPLERVPDQMTCPACGERLGLSEEALSTIPTPSETQVVAVLL